MARRAWGTGLRPSRAIASQIIVGLGFAAMTYSGTVVPASRDALLYVNALILAVAAVRTWKVKRDNKQED